MPYTTLAARLDGHILYLTLNRPKIRNAMSLEMINELLAALADAESVESAGSVRAIVLRGAEGNFCAGADLIDLSNARARVTTGEDTSAIARVNRRFGELCQAFALSPLPTIAVLEGTVQGGGLGLACCVDVALADSSVSFRLPETSLGLIPAQIAPYLVERLGYSQARRLAVTGGRIDGETALRIGLVHEYHPAKVTLHAALERTLRDILACAPQALAHTKTLVRKAYRADPEMLLDDAATLFAQLVLSDEGMEGLTAFAQKRKAAWIP